TTATAGAQEFVPVLDRLSDRDFYRLVACAASPGGACRKPILRWPEGRRAKLGVALASVAPGVSADRRALFRAGLDAAMTEVNALETGIVLRPARGSRGQIDIHIVSTPPGEIMRETGVPGLDGTRLPLARVELRIRDGEIGAAMIAVSAEVDPAEIASILLEEIVQALGLVTDIVGPAYGGSIFSETGNSVEKLAGQDAMALRRHYAEAPGAPGEEG
ncbi:MAG: DUF2927 domain-containing protein, partial [Jannaschia sp.]